MTFLGFLTTHLKNQVNMVILEATYQTVEFQDRKELLPYILPMLLVSRFYQRVIQNPVQERPIQEHHDQMNAARFLLTRKGCEHIPGLKAAGFSEEKSQSYAFVISDIEKLLWTWRFDEFCNSNYSSFEAAVGKLKRHGLQGFGNDKRHYVDSAEFVSSYLYTVIFLL